MEGWDSSLGQFSCGHAQVGTEVRWLGGEQGRPQRHHRLGSRLPPVHPRLIQPAGELTSAGKYGPVGFGSSFIMAVELTKNGPKARTLLTYSESANPASPHFTDQTLLFSRGLWVTDRFSEADIAASPDLHVSFVRW